MKVHALIQVSLFTLFSLSYVRPEGKIPVIGGGQNCANMLALAMYISCLLFRFQLRLVPNVNPISSGIWALDFKA